LLYVTDTITNDLYVFSYPKGKLLQTIPYLNVPAGECVDATGNVFVTNTGGSEILKFAHGGTTAIATLKDPGFFPIGCAIDPASGNLAVANFAPSSSTRGNVVIYKHAKGRPTGNYTDPNMSNMQLCAYDDKGNLFVDGSGLSSYSFAFAELPKGGKKLKDIALDQPITFGGGVAWDGAHVTVGDQSTNIIYRFDISGTTGTKVGTTRLRGATQIFQYTFAGSKLIGADAYGGNVGVWKYPQGGNARKKIGGLYAPLGVAVSPAATARR
jgi:DNA-binding beta-propeller fold protein YncE